MLTWIVSVLATTKRKANSSVLGTNLCLATGMWPAREATEVRLALFSLFLVAGFPEAFAVWSRYL
jgi:hypothetical protein